VLVCIYEESKRQTHKITLSWRKCKNSYLYKIGECAMYGLILNEIEKREFEYLLKREMEELILDLKSREIDSIVKRAMRERYCILYKLFKRFADHADCIKYLPSNYFTSKAEEK
jgi:hypothetical protein